MFTLKHFAEYCVKPTILAFIESGRADNILLDTDVIEVIIGDDDLFNAFVSRIPALRLKHATMG